MPKIITQISKKELESRLSAAREVLPNAFPYLRHRYMKEPKLSKKLAESRRRAEKTLASMLFPQFDSKRFDELQKECSLELDRIGKERQAAAVKASARIKKTLLAQIESKRKGLERLEKLEARVLLDPFLIWGTVYNPYYSTLKFEWDIRQHSAKMRLVGRQADADPLQYAGDGVHLSFYYLWQNDSNYPIRISADTSLVLNGFCSAKADGYWAGWWQGKSASLTLYTSLIPWQWWTNPPIPFPVVDGTYELKNLYVEGGIASSAREEEIAESNFFSVSNIEVPPRELVVFEVQLSSQYLLNGSGEIVVDFSYGSFELSNPYLSLSIGRPPFPRPPFPFPL